MRRAQSAGYWRSPAIAVLVVTAFLGCGGKDDSADLGADAGHQGLCGNGKLDKGEACDGTNFGGETCASLTMGASSGTPRCAEDCASIITDGCTGGGGEGGSGASSGAGATTGVGGAGATTGIGGAGATTGIGGNGATTGIGGPGGRSGGNGGTLGRGTPG